MLPLRETTINNDDKVFERGINILHVRNVKSCYLLIVYCLVWKGNVQPVVDLDRLVNQWCMSSDLLRLSKDVLSLVLKRTYQLCTDGPIQNIRNNVRSGPTYLGILTMSTCHVWKNPLWLTHIFMSNGVLLRGKNACKRMRENILQTWHSKVTYEFSNHNKLKIRFWSWTPHLVNHIKKQQQKTSLWLSSITQNSRKSYSVSVCKSLKFIPLQLLIYICFTYKRSHNNMH